MTGGNIQALCARVEQAAVDDQSALVLVDLVQHEMAEGGLKVDFPAADDLVDKEGLTRNHFSWPAPA